MSEPTFKELTAEEGFDIDAIFGASATSTESNPFEQAEMQTISAAPEKSAAAEKSVSAPEPKAPAQEEPAPEETAINPLEAAFAQQTVDNAKQGLFEKLPVFSYGNAKEDIEDTSLTFEELRIKKADDFPELEDGKSVSWVVKYGDTKKTITDPKGTTIAKAKEDIEKSKAFLDGLKKAKNKNPDCLVTPSVTAKSKGIESYRGVFSSLEEARASDKVICLFPAKDGQVYERRQTEMGEFIAPKSNIVDFSEVRAGFTPALPLIPRELIGQIISFFRCFMHGDEEYEALAYIYWDKVNEEYVAFIPQQTVSKASVYTAMTGNSLPEERYIHYADIHSHNSMTAKFSPVDDHDEKATRIYIVLGHLDYFYPTISVRASCGGTFLTLSPETVLEGVGEEFPAHWLDQVEKASWNMTGVFPQDMERLREEE